MLRMSLGELRLYVESPSWLYPGHYNPCIFHLTYITLIVLSFLLIAIEFSHRPNSLTILKRLALTCTFPHGSTPYKCRYTYVVHKSEYILFEGATTKVLSAWSWVTIVDIKIIRVNIFVFTKKYSVHSRSNSDPDPLTFVDTYPKLDH